MTAVASAPTFSQISRPAWGSFSGNNPMNPDEVRGGVDMFTQRKPPLARSNSSSSISSTSSNSSTTTVATNGSQANGTPLSVGSEASQWSANGAPRKRPQQQKGAWPHGKGEPPQELSRISTGRSAGMAPSHGQMQIGPFQPQMAGQGMMRPMTAESFAAGQPVLYLLSLNGTFDRKTIAVPFAPDSLRIGRQTNQKTIPSATNGFFDSKVLSRQHAEIWAERGSAKIFIRDVKSSNGTFVNGTRLSQENRESDPHELQTADHLELGIDIVSEDQKTVVHHKVAAKVEHAGLLNSSNNVMDMNFGELDPANNSAMMPPGPMQMRGRNGNPSVPNNGRMMFNGMAVNSQPQPNAMPQQRPFFLTPVATDQILKRLANEMRSARLQAQDLGRTNHFINTLLSKEDIKDLEKPEAPEPPKSQPLVNGNGIPFRTDPKTRFSDPPAPPPQQPLPEKPDVPSLKRGPTERPKLGPANASPTRQDNLNQIIQLTEALNSARRDIDSQTTRMRELEELLQKERSAREEAEGLAKQLEETVSSVHVNGKPAQRKGSVREAINHAFRSYEDKEETNVDESPEEKDNKPSETDIAAKEMATALQSRIDNMDNQMLEMKQQMEKWKQRCEAAESERDADRRTLAEMVIQLRAEEAQTKAAQRARSQSRQRRVKAAEAEVQAQAVVKADAAKAAIEDFQVDGSVASDEHMEKPTLSRTNTITPYSSQRPAVAHDNPLQMGLPYASMLGVVLVGMGLMAYLNGWQSPPPRLEQ